MAPAAYGPMDLPPAAEQPAPPAAPTASGSSRGASRSSSLQQQLEQIQAQQEAQAAAAAPAAVLQQAQQVQQQAQQVQQQHQQQAQGPPQSQPALPLTPSQRAQLPIAPLHTSLRLLQLTLPSPAPLSTLSPLHSLQPAAAEQQQQGQQIERPPSVLQLAQQAQAAAEALSMDIEVQQQEPLAPPADGTAAEDDPFMDLLSQIDFSSLPLPGAGSPPQFGKSLSLPAGRGAAAAAATGSTAGATGVPAVKSLPLSSGSAAAEAAAAAAAEEDLEGGVPAGLLLDGPSCATSRPAAPARPKRPPTAYQQVRCSLWLGCALSMQGVGEGPGLASLHVSSCSTETENKAEAESG